MLVLYACIPDNEIHCFVFFARTNLTVKFHSLTYANLTILFTGKMGMWPIAKAKYGNFDYEQRKQPNRSMLMKLRWVVTVLSTFICFRPSATAPPAPLSHRPNERDLTEEVDRRPEIEAEAEAEGEEELGLQHAGDAN